jgi:hypothetical protein
MIEWGSPARTGASTRTTSEDDVMTSAVLDGVRRMLLRLADSQDRHIDMEIAADPESACPEAVEGYRMAAHVLREVASALGVSAAAVAA